MTTIVTSSYRLDTHTQIDGRIYVFETFVDNLGNVYENFYLAAVGADYDAILAVHTAELNEQLANQDETPP